MKFISNSKILNLVISFLLFGNFKIVFADDNNWKPTVIFLLGGQSNMDGRGSVVDLPKDFKTNPVNVRIWSNGKGWEELKPTIQFGPEVGFAIEMSKKWPKQQMGLIKLGTSGMSMFDWDPLTDKSPTKVVKANQGSLFKSWMQMLDNAKKKSPDAKVKAVLWMQGETDAMNEELSKNFKITFKQLIEAVRQETGVKNLPYIYGKIQADPVPSIGLKYTSAIWKAQEEIVKEIPYTVYMNTDKIDVKSDQIHFTAKGQLDLGNRFAVEVLKITNKVK